MLNPLQQEQKLSLYRMIREGHLPDMGEPVARMLVDMLNVRRVEHARRLWTNWFDALLVRTSVSTPNGGRLPGSLGFIDVSAWWLGLTSHMVGDVKAVQSAVAEMSRDRPLVEIYASREAYGWADRLRRGSLAVLTRLQSQPREAATLLQQVNQHRAQIFRQQHIRMREGMGLDDIALLIGVLEAAPGWYGAPAELLQQFDPVGFATSIVRRHTAATPGMVLYALAEVHRRDDPALAARLYQEFPLPLVQDAILARLILAEDRLRQSLRERVIGQPGEIAGSQVGVDGSDRDTDSDSPTARMRHFFGWYDTVHSLQLDCGKRERALIQQALRELCTMVEKELVPELSERLAGLTMLSDPRPVIERVAFVNELRSYLFRRGMMTSAASWQANEGQQVADIFRRLSLTGEAEKLPVLSEYFKLAGLLGYPITVTAGNLGLAMVAEAALIGEMPLTGDDLWLVERIVGAARQEKKQSKWWTTQELERLIKAADRAGMKGTVAGVGQQ